MMRLTRAIVGVTGDAQVTVPAVFTNPRNGAPYPPLSLDWGVSDGMSRKVATVESNSAQRQRATVRWYA